MSYASVVQLREYLAQAGTDATTTGQLQEVLDRAADIVDGQLGFTWSAYGAAANKDVRAPMGVTDTLELPAHEAGSVTAVLRVYGKGTSSESTSDPDDWEELEDGRLYRYGGWAGGAWYRVTAEWGYGPAPAALEEVVLELAINLWGARDSRQISDVVGVEGAVGYNRALTNRQRMIVDDCRRRAGELGFA